MKLLLSLLFFCGMLLNGAALLQAVDFTYSFSAPTLKNQPAYADPGFQKLSGKGKNSSVIWRYRDNKRKPVVIKFHFVPGTKLTEAAISYFRPHAVRKHTINYGIKNIKFFGISADGKKFPIGGIVLNQPYAKPANEPERAIIKFAVEPKSITAAEMHITGNNGRLALRNISFRGSVPAAAAPKSDAAAAEVSPWQKDIDAAPRKLDVRYNGSSYILSNPHVVYAVNPDAGGSVALAYDRSRKVNLVRNGVSAIDWGPFFQDRFYPGGVKNRDAFRQSRFQVEKPEKFPDRITLRLRGRGKHGHLTGVLIEKKFTLRADSPLLEVEYAIHNMPENVVPLRYGFWNCGGINSPKGYNMIVPGKKQIVETGFFPGYREYPEISGNWYAARTPDDHVLACIMPGELLKNICFWTSGTHRGTMECKFGIYYIKAGDALRFKAALVPFGGIGTPHGVSFHAAGNIKPEKISLQFFRQGSYRLKVFTGKVRKEKVTGWKEIKDIAVKDPGKYFTCPLPPVKADAVKAELYLGSEMVLRLEKTFSGKEFLLTPAAVRRQESTAGEQAALNLNFNSTAVKSDFWSWAVPLAGKAPRILGINYKSGGSRDMVELALRFGIKFDTHYISGRWTLSEHQDISDAQCAKELKHTLKKDYDVIMISGDIWKKFPAAVTNLILQKVKNGTGLILISPEGLPAPLTKLCKPVPRRKISSSVKWQKKSEHPIVSGLPFEALPPSAVTPYAVKGETLVQAGKDPLLSLFSFGKGKVALFTYPSADSRARGRRSGFFLPRMEYIKNLPEWAYHEYQMALLARTVCFNARWQTPVKSGSLRQLAPQKLELTLESDSVLKSQICYSLRDRFSAPVGRYKKEFQLKKGKNVLLLELPALPDMTGRFFVNVQVNSESGTIWWGAVSGEKKSAGQITALQFAEKVYEPSGSISGKVTTSGRGDLRISAFDSAGNCFASTSQKDFSFPLADCTTYSGRIRAELLSGGKVIDRKEKRFDLRAVPDPLNFNVAFGWPSLSLRAHRFNYPTFIKQMQKFGITCLNGDRYALDILPAEQAWRDSGVPQFSTQTHGFLGTKKPYNRNLVPKHKFELVRTPCLSSPAFRKKLAADSANLYPNYRLGALMVAGPDESNMFAQWDGCFTPDCRRKFRVWLKEEYGSLEKLNRSWDTDFKKWDDVTAMTLAEVRNRRSYAPWLDHRTFNDWNRADALKELSEGIRKTAPLGYSFSGTQETNPFNAWDWYLMMPHLGGVSSYYGEQTVQHRSFARGRFFQMPWIGYDSQFRMMNRQLWTALMNGATGVNIYGASFYIQPDFTMPRSASELIRVVKHWTRGAAQTLQSADLPDSPIAIHYTPASLKVNEILELTAMRSSAVAGIRTLLNEKNLSFRYLAYGEIEKNQFRNVRILILPLSTALSPEEVKNISAWVEKGGVVIADMLTGTFDEHGAPAKDPGLAALFGIRKPGTLQRRTGMFSLGGSQVKVAAFESGIAPAPGTAVLGKNPDGTPAALLSFKGRGAAVYMGAALLSACGDLQEVRYSDSNANIMREMLKLFSRTLDHAKISSPVRVPGLRSAEVMIRDLGDIRFAGIGRNIEETANNGSKKEVRKVILDRKYHIYDLFTRKYIDHAGEFNFTFTPDGQEIFALLPYRIKEISLSCDSGSQKEFRITAEVVTGTRKAGVHTLRFVLKDPSGRERPEYSSWQRTVNGKVTWRWKAPLNALPGKWHLAVTETISGKKRLLEIPIRH